MDLFRHMAKEDAMAGCVPPAADYKDLRLSNLTLIRWHQTKQVFTSVDFTVPQVRQDPNSIMNTALIDAVLPTIKYALEDGAKSVAL